MTSIKGGSLPPALQRDRALSTTARTLGEAATLQADKGVARLGDAGEQGIAALAHGGMAVVEVADAGISATKAAGNSARGIGAGLLGGIAKVASKVTDALGAALQWMGKGLIHAGNAAREVSGMGGPIVTTRTVLGDVNADAFADRMLRLSKDAFSLAGRQWMESVNHLAAGGVETVECAQCVVAAAQKTVEAAALLGDAAVLKAAQASVVVARQALLAAEKGVDGAGILLQRAGQAVIQAGNAVNTERANDTGSATLASRG